MNKEIERKFLVKPFLIKEELSKAKAIHYHDHAYLVSSQSYQVRVELHRSKDSAEETVGRINIKGPRIGVSRIEFEYPIPLNEAKLIHSFCNFKIKKTRYKIPYEIDPTLTWEVDIYHGDNEGLITAEIEIPEENMTIKYPDWIIREITHDDRFYNKNLSIRPFNSWSLSEMKQCYSEDTEKFFDVEKEVKNYSDFLKSELGEFILNQI